MEGELYFSERESGVPLPEREAISAEFWAGFVALVHRLIAEGRLAERFPVHFCLDLPSAVTGCNPEAVGLAFRGENPGIAWPLQPDAVPDTLLALDAVEFFYRFVSEPGERIGHDRFAHEHFTGFIPYRARLDYVRDVNRIFRRNRHPYEFQTDGRIARLAPSVLREMLLQAVFNTGDAELDGLLETAREKFLSPDLKTRRESLEKLWDAWERLKTIEDIDKKSGLEKLLALSIPQQDFRDRVEKEAQELTQIGNHFTIRHYECGKPPIEKSEQVDYLFHRMFSLMWMLLKATNRLR